jgi:hypothetical protein
MDAMPSSVPVRSLNPLPYHVAILDYLKTEEAELWNWFSSNRVRDEHAEAVRLDLLKTTYRIERDSQPQLYAIADDVLAELGLQAPVTIYQAQGSGNINAALAYVPGQAHLILVGTVLSNLSPLEQKALLGHELAHFALLDGWNGDFQIVSEMLRALVNDPASHPSHAESARLFGLYTEIFADRGALRVTSDPGVAIATLLKIETGLTEVSAESYFRQMEEIFSKSQEQANQPTHPEPYIRARSLKLWAEKGEDAADAILQMIEGRLALDRLDLLGQKQIAGTTRRLLNRLLTPRWFHTEPVLGHARLFFPDFAPGGDSTVDQPLEASSADAKLQDYFCYVLLDFVAVDGSLEDLPLAAALRLSDQLQLGPRFREIALRELSIGKRHFHKVERDAAELLVAADLKMNDS